MQRILRLAKSGDGRGWGAGKKCSSDRCPRRGAKCPSIEKWIKKRWYIYTMENYSAIRRNEIVPFAETWMDLETVIQGEVSQKEKNKYHVLTHICGI